MYIQLPQTDLPSTWTPTPVSHLPSWEDAKRIAIDVETCDPQLTKLGPGVRRGGYVVGISFAIEDGPAYYLPIRHAVGELLPEEQVWQYLRDQAKVFRGEVVGANLQYDLDYLWEKGVVFQGMHRDITVADPLIYELHFSYSLEAVSQRWGFQGKDESTLREAALRWGIDPQKKKKSDKVKANLWRLPAKHVAEYAISDVTLPLMVLRKQEQEIRNQDLGRVWELESKLLPVLLKMRRRGVRIDKDKLQYISDWAERVEAEEMAKLNGSHKVGPHDCMKAVLLAPILEEATGAKLPLTKHKKPKPRINADWLKAHPCREADALLRARQFNKLRTTFCKQVWEQLVGDRVHCSFNQSKVQKPMSDDTEGAAWGRCSSSNFNITNQPTRHPEYGQLWRSIFIPDEGKQWCCCDYSQQEPRLLVHFSCIMGYDGAEEAAERYRQGQCNYDAVARMVLDPEYDGDKRVRDRAKTLFLAKIYGLGQRRLCEDLGVPTQPRSFEKNGKTINYIGAGPEGQEILNRFRESFPFASLFDWEAKDRAKHRGWVKTIYGRRCRFLPDGRGGYMEGLTRKALNRIIQGSAGEQTKQAMVDADEKGLALQIMVHDELNKSVSSREEAEALSEVMVNAVRLRVPVVADVGLGPNWGEAK
jgi:DNA polymerase I-like protein with 3'-5' exonuclease and polymerase domains